MDRRERVADVVEATRLGLDGQQQLIWTALPGIVVSYDPDAMSAVIQPTVPVRVQMAPAPAPVQWVNLPPLQDVPVIFPGGGGTTLTFPITAGDECMVVFQSRCIDGWWATGQSGAQQPDIRMHDLSDGIAYVGLRNKTRSLNPSVTAVELRRDDGSATIRLKNNGDIQLQNSGNVDATCATLTAEASSSATITSPTITLAGNVTINGNLHVTGNTTVDGDTTSTGPAVFPAGANIAGRDFVAHEHTYVGHSSGTYNTGGVV